MKSSFWIFILFLQFILGFDLEGTSLHQDSTSCRELYVKASSYLREGDFHKAELTYNQLLEEFPYCENKEHVLFERNVSRFKQAQWKGSREDFLVFTEAYPHSDLRTVAYYYMAQASFQLLMIEKKDPISMKKQLLEDVQRALAWQKFNGSGPLGDKVLP